MRQGVTWLLIAGWGWIGLANAEDRVTIQQRGQSGRTVVSGQIRDYTGRELTLLTTAGTGVQKFRAEEVVEISTTYLSSHDAGVQALRDGALQMATEKLLASVEQESRRWVQREILAQLVQCALRQRDYVNAVTRFLMIVETDPETPHYRVIPLVWTETPPITVPLEARGWIRADRLSAQLIGASWLLETDEQPLAEQTLRRLAQENDLAIQRLAQAQLWRLRLGQPNVSKTEVRRWEQQLEGFPVALRGGPYFLAGRGYAQLQDWLPATAAWMWLPLEYPERRDLAATAQLMAAVALSAAGDRPGALRLAHEVAIHYAETPQAVTARDLINNWTKPEPQR
jgi:hypothetical protein